MSHTSVYKYKVKDLQTLKRICERKGVECSIGEQEVKQWAMGTIPAVASIKIPTWKYSIAVQADGSLLYDAWGGQSNAMADLGKLIQDYNQEVIIQSAFLNNMRDFYIENLPDGSRKVILEYE